MIEAKMERLAALFSEYSRIRNEIEAELGKTDGKKSAPRPRGKKQKDLDLPLGKLSDCCGKQIVTAKGRDGADRYECINCGDPCDILTEENKQKRKGIFHECCGSSGRRHKKDCPDKNP